MATITLEDLKAAWARGDYSVVADVSGDVIEANSINVEVVINGAPALLYQHLQDGTVAMQDRETDHFEAFNNALDEEEWMEAEAVEALFPGIRNAAQKAFDEQLAAAPEVDPGPRM